MIRRSGPRTMALGIGLLGLVFLILPDGVAAQARQQVEAGVAAWRESLWSEAEAAGVSRATFELALKGFSLDWSLPDLDPPGNSTSDSQPVRQAEFASPGRYFDEGGLRVLVSRGRAELARRGAALQAIERRYGVPASILVAIWGRETVYGSVKIPHDALRSLATLAYMGRRSDFFRPQLIAALKLLDEGHVSRQGLRSSWAGAMGHTQMLPGHILEYGVDFDGDGRRDVWTSVGDALASTANFLARNGWQPGLPWGYEVNRPPGADCTLEGPHQGRTFAEWLALGYERTRGRNLPPARLGQEAFLLQPAGRYGPAFLVTGNFYALKTYNESDLYALYVGHLADRLGNDRPFANRWGNVTTYRRGEVKALQQVLVAKGLNVGDSIDGLIGFRTRVAVGTYQRATGLEVDCWPGPKTMARARRDR